jgi:hypothetical protein
MTERNTEFVGDLACSCLVVEHVRVGVSCSCLVVEHVRVWWHSMFVSGGRVCSSRAIARDGACLSRDFEHVRDGAC